MKIDQPRMKFRNLTVKRYRTVTTTNGEYLNLDPDSLRDNRDD